VCMVLWRVDEVRGWLHTDSSRSAVLPELPAQAASTGASQLVGRRAACTQPRPSLPTCGPPNSRSSAAATASRRLPTPLRTSAETAGRCG
jgi:hypothetical protein